ncbi:ABC transporter ATP-binding protein [Sphingomonas abaci]|uniref:Iron complex transport system ATP-binding protein n=1 Tax=Sphingomonas abaci TaxID=237611 RepID=A0A7W7AI72_9SPHN|nr:ABC transporter ATP-binding protein [Sphingomonas abaci]MBB4616709.1 iron complex transport system ATP-binding protein [Sphingomonas abaci]
MALILDSVGVTLGGRHVLADVSARLEPGRITAILGPNGAGKSSLVKAMAALLAHDGRVALDDRPVASLSPETRARRIGYLPQDATVHWNMRVAEIVALGRLPHRRAPFGESDADRTAIAAAMAATGTMAFADRLVGTLSGGERARVLLARVLAGAPEWLLADEPLASLDPAHQIDLLDRLRAVAASGAGVVVVLHDLVQAAREADDVLLLHQGRVAGFGLAGDVLTAARLAETFGVRVVMVEKAGRRLPVPIGRIGLVSEG